MVYHSITFTGTRAGVFANVFGVLGTLLLYEEGKVDQVDIKFGHGIYSEPSRGDPNWFDYYWQPIHFSRVPEGERTIPVEIGIMPLAFSVDDARRISRVRVHELIGKYLHLRPEISQMVEDFVEKHWTKTVIGVHYRATEKSKEAKTVDPHVVWKYLDDRLAKVLEENPRENVRVFVATDVQQFLDETIKRYPGMIIHTDSIRSTNKYAIHQQHSGYQIGLEAVIDAYLLSRSNYFIRTASNVGRMSMFLNPKMPVLTLNYCFWRDSPDIEAFDDTELAWKH